MIAALEETNANPKMARLTSILLFAGGAVASVSTWGQCGGIGYTGDTVCVAGATCTSYNAYYYQCIPGTATSTTAAPTSSVVTTTSGRPTSTSTATSSGPTQTGGVKYFISFGDSYSQTGFDYTGTKASAANPLGNPALPGWTASGGLNWVGFMVTEFNKSLTLSYNFAYGGATVDATLVAPYTSTVLSFIDQVGQFSASLATHPSYAPWTAQNTIVGVWMGVNDVGNSYWVSNVNDLMAKVVAKYFEQLEIIYQAGARKFVLLSVPPITKTPLMLGQSQWARDTEDAVIATYNSLIQSNLSAFKAKHSDIIATVVDTAAPFNQAINNPTAYGAPDATCYNADGTSCLWFNDYHPGIAINRLVAAAVTDAIAKMGA